ncbi:alpha/beta hydrolase [Blastococcus sp. TF02A_35]|uniref:alpha/beta fold hydrolase n=1 Tax=Blastococcus sp. TF02A-35 TaxID=2559612 RepID=UPI00107396A7|nr:alpha/beta hydrolase [Blastococcus sp. TF02A_35]TFV51908.1 alpha/beta hydrolase [Blastococcus sp. TF02A_35]
MPTYAAADGTPLAYDLVGAGGRSPLVVVAGGACLPPGYLGDLAGLSGVRPLLLPHLRGVGESPRPAEPEAGSYWRQAEDVEALRAHLGVERLALAAHSAGTRLALAWAARFPGSVERLLLVTPPAGVVPGAVADGDAVLDARRGDPAVEAALAARERGPDLTGSESYTAYVQSVMPLSYAAWTARERAHAAPQRYDVEAIRAYFSVPPPEDLVGRCAGVSAPVLVVAGAQDPVGPTPPRVVARLFPRGEVVTVDRCGHFPWVEQPDAFRRAVDPFVTG